MNTVQLKSLQQVKIDDFTRAYMEAALALSYYIPNENQGQVMEESLDCNYSIEDIAPETLGKMIADCQRFQLEYSAALKTAYNESYGYYTASQAGHDFWLTRNGHGAGFWDRGLGKPGDDLTEAAHTFSEVSLVLGDDGKIYQE